MIRNWDDLTPAERDALPVGGWEIVSVKPVGKEWFVWYDTEGWHEELHNHDTKVHTRDGIPLAWDR